MKRTLTPIGDGLGLVIDRSLLELLHIDRETVLEIRSDGRTLVIEPVDRDGRKRKVLAAAERVMKAHDATLRKLAK
ncbi:MAG: AbrB/MazE/SpoVT family DNA-binding domain-containing protein [Myxococcaceae bacterium]